ncbi:SRPBCC family protein [Granulicella cerasi]|uniref:SRPBCC family protein n=1 Tax=Granulicella cerasi TaxID=741063 RepID=A0ABW1Z9K4_9BACT|nr:SRPBCC family protein [Granulicella cerasi]
MRRVFGWLVVLLIVFVGVVLMLASRKPDSYRVERTTKIHASADKINPLLQDMHHFALWSPWQHLDPNMKETFSGPPVGVGATVAWVGNSKAGEGNMKVLTATPYDTTLDLHFIKPFESDAKVEYQLTPQTDGTQVTWIMSGPLNFMSKVMCVFKNMDAMIGPDFERGLAQMKRVAEDPQQP